jgi:hypothetical protein
MDQGGEGTPKSATPVEGKCVWRPMVGIVLFARKASVTDRSLGFPVPTRTRGAVHYSTRTVGLGASSHRTHSSAADSGRPELYRPKDAAVTETT